MGSDDRFKIQDDKQNNLNNQIFNLSTRQHNKTLNWQHQTTIPEQRQ
jgi:hypothetical protein